jgi:hypothetical protein
MLGSYSRLLTFRLPPSSDLEWNIRYSYGLDALKTWQSRQPQPRLSLPVASSAPGLAWLLVCPCHQKSLGYIGLWGPGEGRYHDRGDATAALPSIGRVRRDSALGRRFPTQEGAIRIVDCDQGSCFRVCVTNAE